jgi:hypothetical protein
MCSSTAYGVATMTNVLPWSPLTEPGTTALPSFGALVSQTVIKMPTITAIAMGIPILWEYTDTEVVSWFAKATKGSFIASIAPTSTHTGLVITGLAYTPIATHTTRPSGSSLSPLAWAGIGLSIAAVCLTILGFFLRLWTSRKAERAGAEQVQQPRQEEPASSASAPEVQQTPPPYLILDLGTEATR